MSGEYVWQLSVLYTFANFICDLCCMVKFDLILICHELLHCNFCPFFPLFTFLCTNFQGVYGQPYDKSMSQPEKKEHHFGFFFYLGVTNSSYAPFSHLHSSTVTALWKLTYVDNFLNQMQPPKKIWDVFWRPLCSIAFILNSNVWISAQFGDV